MTFASTAPAPTADSAENWVGMILRELGRSQAGGFALDVVLWTLLGALAGFLLAVCSFMLFSRLG